MFEEVLGLPAHPLTVHAPIVLVPLLIMVALGYALIPPLRRALGLALVVLSMLAPASVWGAREAGFAFRERLAARDMMPAELSAQVDEHATASLRLFWFTVALGVVGLVLAMVGRAMRRSPEEEYESESGSGRGVLIVIAVLLAIAVLGLSGASGYYLFETGDSGSRMVWEGS
ncbi:MAG: DUF2231 domain-containing protein [Micromonosporaceae bacterium]